MGQLDFNYHDVTLKKGPKGVKKFRSQTASIGYKFTQEVQEAREVQLLLHDSPRRHEDEGQGEAGERAADHLAGAWTSGPSIDASFWRRRSRVRLHAGRTQAPPGPAGGPAQARRGHQGAAEGGGRGGARRSAVRRRDQRVRGRAGTSASTGSRAEQRKLEHRADGPRRDDGQEGPGRDSVQGLHVSRLHARTSPASASAARSPGPLIEAYVGETLASTSATSSRCR